MFHIAVCDDEEYFRIREKKLIEEYMKNRGFACQTDLFPSGKEMLEAAESIQQYDVIFLDISMEEMDGIETARRIRQVSPDVYIVFVTAYITYALEGYKVNAVRYLLKEDAGLESALKECLDTIAALMDYAEVKCEIVFQGGRKSIPVDSILYVESRLHKVIFFVMEDGLKEYYKYGRLDEFEPELRQYGFFRVHQSFLVNMRLVQSVERYVARLKNGTEVSISKKYYRDTEMEYIRVQGEL